VQAGEAGAIWRLRAAVPAPVRAGVAGAIPPKAARELTAKLELRGHAWETTRAFAHPADNQGYVRFNLRGREREGIVAADDAAALGEEIAEGLASFEDPDGAPAVESVRRVADLYPGLRAGRLPDLVVRWSPRPATELRELVSPRYGVARRAGAGSGRSCNHTPGDAWALVVPGAGEHRDPSRPARLIDVAATVCAATRADRSGLAGESLLGG
jgi:predicted AlkP superfamily phosphohydrolase/phosphomutase